MSGKVRKAVIPVAGLGTRGLPFTKEVPKEMMPIIDIPTIQFIVEEVLAAGIEQVIFVTSKGKSALEDFFDPSPNLENWLRKRGKEDLAEKIHRIGSMCEVMSVRQKQPLGLGHAIACARPMIGNDRFAVCLGDEIFPPWDSNNQKQAALSSLVKAAEEVSGSVVGTVEIDLKDSGKYGVLDLGGAVPGDKPVKVLGTVEKPKPEEAPSPYAIIGRYVFEPELFECLDQVTPGAGGEIQLTDGMAKLAKAGKMHALRITGCRYDIGNQFFFVKAQIDEALRRPELAPKIKAYIQSLCS